MRARRGLSSSPVEDDDELANPVLDRPRDTVLRVRPRIAQALTDGDTSIGVPVQRRMVSLLLSRLWLLGG
jgi:hypothetical protein